MTQRWKRSSCIEWNGTNNRDAPKRPQATRPRSPRTVRENSKTCLLWFGALACIFTAYNHAPRLSHSKTPPFALCLFFPFPFVERPARDGPHDALAHVTSPRHTQHVQSRRVGRSSCSWASDTWHFPPSCISCLLPLCDPLKPWVDRDPKGRLKGRDPILKGKRKERIRFR